MNFVPLKGTDKTSANRRIPFKTLHALSLFLAAGEQAVGESVK
jgi:hypothetical protein